MRARGRTPYHGERMVATPIDIVKHAPDNGRVTRKQAETVMVNVRVEISEMERWRKAAAAEQRNITSLVRRAVDVYLRDMEARGEFPGKDSTE